MGKYLKRYWSPDGSGMTKRERMGGAYFPYVPDKLCKSPFSLSTESTSALVAAHEALARLESSVLLTDTEPLARLLLRSEAISSSRIEGLEVPASKLLEYEELNRLGVSKRLDSVEAQVIGNLHALTESIENLSSQPLSVESICKIHKILFTGTRKQDIGGVIRKGQNWIGGNRVNPVGAAYVPPEPERVLELLEDLVKFVNDSELPAVAIAAIAHAQFETIHPFADGNGRIGRALVHFVLRCKTTSRVTIPPVSLILATDHERYIANLNSYRSEGTQNRDEAINNWIEYFANALCLSCKKAGEFENHLNDIRERWNLQTDFRADSAGHQLLSILPGNPVISIVTAQKLVNKSYPAVLNAVNKLVDVGILRQNSKNRKSGIYVADDILNAFNKYERSLATLSGDTASEKPRRNVPQKRN